MKRQPRHSPAPPDASALQLPPAQKVLVLQGGGALGAYQVGVYQALHERGIEPDWVIGTSIGAINGALIVGNPPERRLQALDAFWTRMQRPDLPAQQWLQASLAMWAQGASIMTHGIPGFFEPNTRAWGGVYAKVGVEQASFYSTTPLHKTLQALVDTRLLQSGRPRLTVGAVSVVHGQMHYFDSRTGPLQLQHIMASAALPPAFPAVRIDGEAYWDGGLYSNTPIEAVMDDQPRRDSLIFAVQLWNPHGEEPKSIWEVEERIKDIQFSSRASSHLARQKQMHRLRHVVRELVQHIPKAERQTPFVQELASWGCTTTMRVIQLNAPDLRLADQFKDIDFSDEGIAARRAAGHADTLRAIAARPWLKPVDPLEGLMVYEVDAGRVHT